MTDLLRRIRTHYRARGLRGLAGAAARRAAAGVLRRIFGLPERRIGVYNGVAVRNVGLADVQDEQPLHEAQLFEAIRAHVPAGADVVLVGGGHGASAVCAARQVGPTGSVRAYEASAPSVATCRDTLRLNQVEDRASCDHAVVGKAHHVRDEVGDAETLTGADLPPCDALVMDCEGAEVEILATLDEFPPLIIVETHAHFGAPSDRVRDLVPDGFAEVATLPRSDGIDVLCFKREP